MILMAPSLVVRISVLPPSSAKAGRAARSGRAKTARRLMAADWGLVDVAGEQARVDHEKEHAA